MSEHVWSESVVLLPDATGVLLWNTGNGARAHLDLAEDLRTPRLGVNSLAPSMVATLEARGFVTQSTERPPQRRLQSSGILGIPAGPLSECLSESNSPDVVVVGAAIDIGTASNPGARHGPEVLRRFSTPYLATSRADNRLHQVVDPMSGPKPISGRLILDAGDLFPVPGDPRMARDEQYRSIATTVNVIRGRGARPLLLGGDHSVTAPSTAGVAEHGLDALVVFDAHLDAEERWAKDFEELTHANFLSVVLNRDPSIEILVLGVRETVGSHLWPLPPRLRCMTVDHGIKYLRRRDYQSVYLSIDLDVIDPAFFPATGHPSPGGLSPGQLAKKIAKMAKHQNIIAADVVEAQHSRGGDYTTGMVGSFVAAQLLTALCLGLP